jgi:hypothetical protein
MAKSKVYFYPLKMNRLLKEKFLKKKFSQLAIRNFLLAPKNKCF